MLLSIAAISLVCCLSVSIAGIFNPLQRCRYLLRVLPWSAALVCWLDVNTAGMPHAPSLWCRGLRSRDKFRMRLPFGGSAPSLSISTSLSLRVPLYEYVCMHVLTKEGG
jgi:hypothetical protein